MSVLGEDTSAVGTFLNRTKLSLPVLIDPQGQATEAWAGKYIPGTCPMKNLYLVNSKGTVQFTTHLPGISAAKLKKELKNLK